MSCLPKPLPLRDWPAFALQPWRELRGKHLLSDDKRHALGRYLAWLGAEDLPPDSTEQALLFRYLEALEARIATKPGFYAALCHLMTALAKVHPATDWDWLHDWRHAWRFRFRRQHAGHRCNLCCC